MMFHLSRKFHQCGSGFVFHWKITFFCSSSFLSANYGKITKIREFRHCSQGPGRFSQVLFWECSLPGPQQDKTWLCSQLVQKPLTRLLPIEWRYCLPHWEGEKNIAKFVIKTCVVMLWFDIWYFSRWPIIQVLICPFVCSVVVTSWCDEWRGICIAELKIVPDIYLTYSSQDTFFFFRTQALLKRPSSRAGTPLMRPMSASSGVFTFVVHQNREDERFLFAGRNFWSSVQLNFPVVEDASWVLFRVQNRKTTVWFPCVNGTDWDWVLFVSVMSTRQVESQLQFFEEEMISFEANLTSKYVVIFLRLDERKKKCSPENLWSKLPTTRKEKFAFGEGLGSNTRVIFSLKVG